MASTSAGASPHTCSNHPPVTTRRPWLSAHHRRRKPHVRHPAPDRRAALRVDVGQYRSGLRSVHRRTGRTGRPGLGARGGCRSGLSPFGFRRVGWGLPGPSHQAPAGVPEPRGGQCRGGCPATHSRARQGPGRRPRRGGPRHREHRVRLWGGRRPEGHAHRTGQHRRRRVHRAPAPGRSGRHNAVQLPGDGPTLDVPQRRGLWEHLHPEAVGTRPLGPAVRGRTVPGGRVPAGCPERGSR